MSLNPRIDNLGGHFILSHCKYNLSLAQKWYLSDVVFFMTNMYTQKKAAHCSTALFAKILLSYINILKTIR